MKDSLSNYELRGKFGIKTAVQVVLFEPINKFQNYCNATMVNKYELIGSVIFQTFYFRPNILPPPYFLNHKRSIIFVKKIVIQCFDAAVYLALLKHCHWLLYLDVCAITLTLLVLTRFSCVILVLFLHLRMPIH